MLSNINDYISLYSYLSIPSRISMEDLQYIDYRLFTQKFIYDVYIFLLLY
jgi:hypothetical protein